MYIFFFAVKYKYSNHFTLQPNTTSGWKAENIQAWEQTENIGVMDVFPRGGIGQASVKHEFTKKVKTYFMHYEF